MVVGLGFKVSAAPFHQWARRRVPRSSRLCGAPSCRSGVKIAGFAAFARVLTVAFRHRNQRLGRGRSVPWRRCRWSSARCWLWRSRTSSGMLASYSGVWPHAGFMLTSLVAGQEGIPSPVVLPRHIRLPADRNVPDRLGGQRLAWGEPRRWTRTGAWPNALRCWPRLWLCSCCGMGGIPLTAGFVGKVRCVPCSHRRRLPVAGDRWSRVGCGRTVLIYLRLIVLAYFEDPTPEAAAEPIRTTRPTQVALAVCVFFTFPLRCAAGATPQPDERVAAARGIPPVVPTSSERVQD